VGEIALVVAAVVAVVGIPYLVGRRRGSVPRFSFRMTNSQRAGATAPDGTPMARFLFTGTVRNGGTESTSLEHVCLVVWRNRRRTATRRFGFGPRLITDNNGHAVAEPIAFNGRESKMLSIHWDVPIGRGALDERLATDVTPLGHGLSKLTYDYELAFEDVNGRLFDQAGRLASDRTQRLWWLLPNTFTALGAGQPWPFIREQARIYGSEVAFLLRRGLWALGL
jgi:hypothetical protein